MLKHVAHSIEDETTAMNPTKTVESFLSIVVRSGYAALWGDKGRFEER